MYAADATPVRVTGAGIAAVMLLIAGNLVGRSLKCFALHELHAVA